MNEGSRSAATTLSAVNNAVHERLASRYLDLLEAFTACRYDEAVTCFAGLGALLEAHLQLEEVHVVPLAADVDDQMARLLTGDHLILQRRLSHLTDLLGRFATDQPPRRAMVQALPELLRLGAVLEHHHLREEQFYPHLEQTLPVAELEFLMATLRTAES